MDTIHFHSVIFNCAMFSIDTISKVNRLPKKINKNYIPILLILSFIPSSPILTRATYHQSSLPQEK